MINDKLNQKFEDIKTNGNWTLPNVAIAAGSFLIFHPVGIAAFAWLALGKNVNIASSLKQKYDEYSPSVKQKFNSGRTSNTAYNQYDAEQVAQYEAQMKRHASEANTFNNFSDSRKQTKDQAEFDEYIKNKNKKG